MQLHNWNKVSVACAHVEWILYHHKRWHHDWSPSGKETNKDDPRWVTRREDKSRGSHRMFVSASRLIRNTNPATVPEADPDMESWNLKHLSPRITDQEKQDLSGGLISGFSFSWTLESGFANLRMLFIFCRLSGAFAHLGALANASRNWPLVQFCANDCVVFVFTDKANARKNCTAPLKRGKNTGPWWKKILHPAHCTSEMRVEQPGQNPIPRLWLTNPWETFRLNVLEKKAFLFTHNVLSWVIGVLSDTNKNVETGLVQKVRFVLKAQQMLLKTHSSMPPHGWATTDLRYKGARKNPCDGTRNTALLIMSCARPWSNQSEWSTWLHICNELCYLLAPCPVPHPDEFSSISLTNPPPKEKLPRDGK